MEKSDLFAVLGVEQFWHSIFEPIWQLLDESIPLFMSLTRLKVDKGIELHVKVIVDAVCDAELFEHVEFLPVDGLARIDILYNRRERTSWEWKGDHADNHDNAGHDTFCGVSGADIAVPNGRDSRDRPIETDRIHLSNFVQVKIIGVDPVGFVLVVHVRAQENPKAADRVNEQNRKDWEDEKAFLGDT